MANAFAHSVVLTSVSHPEPSLAVIVKLAKRDAIALARQIDQAESLYVEPRPEGGVRIRLWAEREHLGAFCDIDHDGPMTTQLLRASTVTLAVSAGGSKRRTLNAGDVVRSMCLANRQPDTQRVRHDPIFDQPPAAWPDASDTLMRYTESAFGSFGSQRPEGVLNLLKIASAFWNAAVAEDYSSNGSLLDDLRKANLPPQLVSTLIRHKRQQFPGDPRIIRDVHFEWHGAEPRFTATSGLPTGYRLNGVPVA